MANVSPVKCSLKFHPPTLIVFYNDLNTKKKRRRSIPLREFNVQTSISQYTDKLYNCTRHRDYVSKIKKHQLESLLERVRSAQSNSPSEMDLNTKQHKTKFLDLNTTLDTTLTNLSELPSLTKPFISKNDQILSFDLDDILNTTTSLVDDELLQDRPGGNNNTNTTNDILPLTKVKPMSTISPLPSLSPSPNENEYEDDFEAPQGITGFHKDDDVSLGTEDLVNLSLSEDIDTDSFDEDDIKLNTPLLQTSELLGNEPIITSDEDYTPDYNKMSETDYIKQKDKMEAKFKKKQLKPGDEGYEYDKEVNFTAPTMESGWDSDDSTESEF